MCSVQEEAIPQQINRLTGELRCAKCKRDVPVVVTRVNDAFCQDCFLGYAVHKFRSAIGKSKVILPKEHVLVAFSGGPASSALLYFIQEGIKEGKLRFTVSVIHVDELGLVSVSNEERKEKLGDVVKIVIERGFPMHLTTLERAMDLGKEEESATSRAVLSQEVTSQTDLGSLLGGDGDGRLKKLMDELPSPSAKEEFIRVMRNQLLVGVARQRGFSKVVLGDTATLLSVRIMTDMAKGKGAQVSFDTSIGDNRYGDVMMVRPLRDLNFKEVEAYNKLQKVDSVSVPNIKDQWHRGNSIEQLTATFIHGLQEDFPSTVPNIVRTSGKLSQGDVQQTEHDKCAMCQSPLDTDVGEASALRAVEISEHLAQAGGSSQSQTDAPLPCNAESNRLTSDDFKASLCYGCRLMMKGLKDTSLLPPQMMQKSEAHCLTRDQMRSKISEFLLEDDGDGVTWDKTSVD